MPLALMVSTVTMLSGGLIVSMVVDQADTTRLQAQKLSALQAAQAGLDSATSAIRVSGGSRTALPCASQGVPMSGSIGAAGTGARYRVVIQYFTTDPAGRSDTWRAANALACTPNAGVAVTPAYAAMAATGTDRPSGSFSGGPTRLLRGTYTFSTTNQNIAGGLIHLWRSSSDTTSPDLCLDAGSGAPAAGTAVTTQVCDAGDLGQKWAYNNNLSLSLGPSLGVSTTLGMCLQAGTGTVGSTVVVQPCAPMTSFAQQWSFNNAASFEGTTDGRTLNGVCFKAQTQNTVNSTVVLAAVCSAAYNRTSTFSPDAAVGAGMAGAGTTQLVDYAQFGRCLDVTGAQTTATDLLSWPCKQVPDPSSIGWNQRWAMPATPAPAKGPNARTGPIITKTTYCLQSPGGTALGQYVTIKTCVAGQADQQWTVLGATSDYASSYRIVDYQGTCLTPRDPNAANPDFYQTVNKISRVYVAVCDSSLLQKWNAPANLVSSRRLKDLAEN